MLFVAGTIFGFDFAQRILAALENPESPGEVADVVAELRAAVERK
jgi:hypothetical protein